MPLTFIVLAAWFPPVLTMMAIVTTWWDVYHSSLQTFGFGRIYDSKQKNDAAVGRRLDYWMNLLVYLGPVLAGAHFVDHLDMTRKDLSPFVVQRGTLSEMLCQRTPDFLQESSILSCRRDSVRRSAVRRVLSLLVLSLSAAGVSDFLAEGLADDYYVIRFNLLLGLPFVHRCLLGHELLSRLAVFCDRRVLRKTEPGAVISRESSFPYGVGHCIGLGLFHLLYCCTASGPGFFAAG